MEQIAKALQLKIELDKLRPIDEEREAIIMQKLRLDWDYHSNHLEGNSLTYGETKALILFGITAQGKPLHDHLEITGHDEAIKWVTEIVKDDYPITEVFIRELHKLLLKEPYERKAVTADGKETTKRIEIGKYKSVPNHVLTRTGEIFRFATPEETPAKMQELIQWYRQKKDARDTNPVILAAEFHYKFILIHPFDDGNGRVARILMNFILMQYGFPPAIIKTDDKSNYFSALQQADSGSYEPFFDYIAKNLVRSLEIMIAGARGEIIEEPDDLDKEIALLEQKLKGVGKKLELEKTREAIIDVFENSIKKLYKAFIETCSKFDRFYSTTEYNISVINNDEHSDIKTDQLANVNAFLKKDTNSVIFHYGYEGFNRSGFGYFNYTSNIVFEFKYGNYVVSVPKRRIEYLYGEQLTEKEINDFVQTEARRHMDFITQKLKEGQNYIS
ncbi:Fic family protein [Longitalea luteola]|uniref:Fic family protein n=1 Tax=Longitalea luteola TaxID=2812563 RepID=UPI001A96EEF3|nr:Fic family protein [Longitalea luteola]